METQTEGNMKWKQDDESLVNVGAKAAKGHRTVPLVPIGTSFKEVLAMVFLVPELQACYQNTFKVLPNGY